MSECVVRMEMPEKCDECPAWRICGTLHTYMLGIDCDSDWTYDDLLMIIVETGFVKPDNCPILCQLPEGHGRLGDLDAVLYSLAKQETIDGQPRAIRRARHIIEREPTIVPSDTAERRET